MRTVEEQLAIITAAAVTPEPVRVAISEALGLRCAEQVEGTEHLPGFDQAAIDGYAVRCVDIRQALDPAPTDDGEESEERPLESTSASHRGALPIVGEVTAGSHRPVRLQPRQCVRPMRVLRCQLWPTPCCPSIGRKPRGAASFRSSGSGRVNSFTARDRMSSRVMLLSSRDRLSEQLKSVCWQA